MIGQFMHKYKCIVHQPKAVFLNPKDFKNPPNKVTKDNLAFWMEEVAVGGSICKNCYWKFNHQPKAEKGRVNIAPNGIRV